ncbi:MAG: chemotaxis protein CheC [Theionarchaea archaeon]|nr:chemotaxis protein CheC [Theionarchaea archaeon]
MKENELKEREKTLEKIGLLSASNAAIALCTIIGEQCNMSNVSLIITDEREACERIQSIMERFSLEGRLLVYHAGSWTILMSKTAADIIAEMVKQKGAYFAGPLDQAKFLLLEEVTNIIGNSYVNMLSDLLDITVIPRPPEAIPLSADALSTVAHEIIDDARYFLFLTNEIQVFNKNVGCLYMIVQVQQIREVLNAVDEMKGMG